MSSSVDVTIRAAQPADMAALGRLGATLVRVHHDFDRDRFMSPGRDLAVGYERFLAAQLEDPATVIFVAEERRPEGAASQILGYVYAGLEPRSWKELREAAGFVHDVVVDEPARGRGIATRLVEAAAEWLEANGAPRVLLWTADRNAPAQRLFARLGFRRTMVEMTRERTQKG